MVLKVLRFVSAIAVSASLAFTSSMSLVANAKVGVVPRTSYVETYDRNGRVASHNALVDLAHHGAEPSPQEIDTARATLAQLRARVSDEKLSAASRKHIQKGIDLLEIVTASTSAERHALVQKLPVVKMIETSPDGLGIIETFVAGGKIRARVFRAYSHKRPTQALEGIETPDGGSSLGTVAPGVDDPCYDDEEGTIEGTCPTELDIDDFITTIADAAADSEASQAEADYWEDAVNEWCEQNSCLEAPAVSPLEGFWNEGDRDDVAFNIPCGQEFANTAYAVGSTIAANSYVAGKVAGQVAATAARASIALWGWWAVIATGAAVAIAITVVSLAECVAPKIH